jgi:hypothetical protein
MLSATLTLFLELTTKQGGGYSRFDETQTEENQEKNCKIDYGGPALADPKAGAPDLVPPYGLQRPPVRFRLRSDAKAASAARRPGNGR